MSLILDGTNGETLPSWTTATRPASPVAGQQGFNTTIGAMESYNGSAWQQFTNGPAFSAYQSSAQTGLTANTYTKVQFQTKEFDTASCFDATTNYRFTPTVAGYYQVTAQVGFNTAMNYGVVSIYKNGSNFKATSAQQTYALSVICNSLIYLNGSTDYIEIYVYPSATLSVVANSQSTFFQASLVRAA